MEATLEGLDDPRTWGERAERRAAVDLEYGDGSPVVITARKRGRNIDLSDEGEAVAKARALGAPRDWLEIAERVVDQDGFNVNRRGVVFVPAFEWRDIAELADRLGETAYAVHVALLEASEP